MAAGSQLPYAEASNSAWRCWPCQPSPARCAFSETNFCHFTHPNLKVTARLLSQQKKQIPGNNIPEGSLAPMPSNPKPGARRELNPKPGARRGCDLVLRGKGIRSEASLSPSFSFVVTTGANPCAAMESIMVREITKTHTQLLQSRIGEVSDYLMSLRPFHFWSLRDTLGLATWVQVCHMSVLPCSSVHTGNVVDVLSAD